MTMKPRVRRPGGRRFFPRKKVCQFCVDKVQHIDYKDVPRIRRFVSEWGKIESRRKTGTCSPHQRMLSLAIKRARFLAFLPYTGAHSQIEMYRPEPRGDRRPRFQDRNAPGSSDRGAPPAYVAPSREPALVGGGAESSAAQAPQSAPAEEVPAAEAPRAEAPPAEAPAAEAPQAEAPSAPEVPQPVAAEAAVEESEK